MDNFEIEFKYKSDEIKLSKYLEFVSSLKPSYDYYVEASSWDYYYAQKKNDSFLRLRLSNIKPELTLKRKLSDTNNWERIELDVPLNPKANQEKLVKIVNSFSEELGYKFNFKIYKTCFIHKIGDIIYVYYVVYNEEMDEKARFIEIEVNKDYVNKFGMERSAIRLREAEVALNGLGINPANRMKKSLFEVFVK